MMKARTKTPIMRIKEKVTGTYEVFISLMGCGALFGMGES